jgi:hypothetical protein
MTTPHDLKGEGKPDLDPDLVVAAMKAINEAPYPVTTDDVAALHAINETLARLNEREATLLARGIVMEEEYSPLIVVRTGLSVITESAAIISGRLRDAATNIQTARNPFGR